MKEARAPSQLGVRAFLYRLFNHMKELNFVRLIQKLTFYFLGTDMPGKDPLVPIEQSESLYKVPVSSNADVIPPRLFMVQLWGLKLIKWLTIIKHYLRKRLILTAQRTTCLTLYYTAYPIHQFPLLHDQLTGNIIIAPTLSAKIRITYIGTENNQNCGSLYLPIPKIIAGIPSTGM